MSSITPPNSNIQKSNYTPIKLYNNRKEREYYENLAELYAVMKATDGIEKAFSKDAITEEEYKHHCSKLASQFSSLKKLCEITTDESIKKFMKDYDFECKLGYDRLVVEGGVPSGSIKDKKSIAETVQHFITTMNALELGMRAVDELLQPLQDLMSSLNQVPMKEDASTKVLVKKWLQILNNMEAHEELSDEQVRQMQLDLSNSYHHFHGNLS